MDEGNQPGKQALPAKGTVHWGDLRRTTPISQVWGFDRGLPIDRYYIEHFLESSAQDIQGHVLEIQEDRYAHRFGKERIRKLDILDILPDNPQATIISDLTNSEQIPSNQFHCVIVTQTLQCIYDVKAAIRTLHRLLAPAGVLLATIPGINRTHLTAWNDSWFWAFTSTSVQRLFEEFFPASNLTVRVYGNVLSSIAFLHGLAVEEVTQDELDFSDPDYELVITVRAVK
jgi:hypothetical protein